MEGSHAGSAIFAHFEDPGDALFTCQERVPPLQALNWVLVPGLFPSLCCVDLVPAQSVMRQGACGSGEAGLGTVAPRSGEGETAHVKTTLGLRSILVCLQVPVTLATRQQNCS